MTAKDCWYNIFYYWDRSTESYEGPSHQELLKQAYQFCTRNQPFMSFMLNGFVFCMYIEEEQCFHFRIDVRDGAQEATLDSIVQNNGGNLHNTWKPFEYGASLRYWEQYIRDDDYFEHHAMLEG